MFMSLGAQTNPDETLVPLLTNQITSGLSVLIYKVDPQYSTAGSSTVLRKYWVI